MPVPEEVKNLVKHFDNNVEDYRKGQLKEAEVRNEFIDPLFKALGWDVDNNKGLAGPYKEVSLEYSGKLGVEGTPDYRFALGGTSKFFVEAKKPSVNLKDGREPALQVRRYAWSAQLPLSILTDFEEFVIYDCRIKPDKDDKADTARDLYLTYDKYAEEKYWDKIYSLFSKEAVQEGSLEEYAKALKTKRGKEPFDKAFLSEIESWREMLARNLALRNDLSRRELNFAVQKTIDRILFLRICEDRGIEKYGRLKEIQEDSGIYRDLCGLFRAADERYNSGLFHFREENGHSSTPDKLTLDLDLADEPLAHILQRLYYPDSPYEFSVVPVEILGQIYERFLGKEILLTSDHQAVIEEKPEVRKAGGVYYTPSYIVDYIVENTVGQLLEDKKPKQVEDIKVVDPACGSGSFLIGAFQHLIDWHRDYYANHGGTAYKNRLFQSADGEWRLRADEKKRILKKNIYGVDIDPQAVEVTKLSLLLKVLEGETEETVEQDPQLFKDRALPDLGNNIKCGNSLIGRDFYRNEQMMLPDEEERERINVFNWSDGFPEIFKRDNPGFDIVLGNPPYIFTRNQGIDEIQKSYFNKRYKHQSAQLNTFGVFVERCYDLLRDLGLLSFIGPNNWLTIDSFVPLREFILSRAKDVKIVNILDRVFVDADVDTAIVALGKGEPTNLTVGEFVSGEESFIRDCELAAIKPPSYIVQISLLKDFEIQQLLDKIELCSQPLSTFCRVSTGLKAYQKGKGQPPQTTFEKDERTFHANAELDETYGPYLQGVDVRRYLLSWSGEYLSYGGWLAEPRKSVPFSGERILVRQIPSTPPYLVHGAFTSEQYYNDINSMVVFAPISEMSLKYLLGLINSKLVSMWFLKTFDKLQRRIFPQFKVKELAMFPMRTIGFSDAEDVTRHERMVGLVERMLEFHEQLAEARTDWDRARIESDISITDGQIDRLVYELYGLTDEEIRTVEDSIN